MMRVLSLAIAATLCASQVSALSCLRPDVASSFQWASQADENYIILLGEFSFPRPPEHGGQVVRPEPVSVPAQFKGGYLGADGFISGANLDVTLTFDCVASWCGSLNSGADQVLAFVEQRPDGYELSVGPCGREVFSEPTPAMIAQVEACMRGDACEARY